LLANHLVAEFQSVVVSRNQPIVSRKYKHGSQQWKGKLEEV